MRANSRGNTLALVAISIIVLVMVAMVVINFAQLLGMHKEVSTATDAAALQAGKDMERLVFNSKTLGVQMALTDDIGTRVDASGQIVSDNNAPPIYGINTIMGTLRLDMIVAGQLKNQRMFDLAQQDLKNAQAAAASFKQEIIAAANGAEATDKFGNKFSITQDALVTYNANSLQLSHGTLVGPLQVILGTLSANSTDIPVPSPASLAQVDATTSQTRNGITYYTANVPVKTQILGQSVTFTFAGTGDMLSLAQDSQFVPLNPTDSTMPCAVQIVANQSATPIASSSKSITVPTQGTTPVTPPGKTYSVGTTLKVLGTCWLGSKRVESPTGVLIVSFPQGVPANGSNVNFSSVNSIMGSTGWNAATPGNWLEAQGGPVPADSSATLVAAQYHGQSTTDPASALSSLTYDWLRSLGLRPNVNSVVTQLSANLSSVSSQSTAQAFDLLPPANAQANQQLAPVSGAIFDLSTDPRSQTNFSKSPDRYRAQLANIFGYKPPMATIPNTGLTTALSSDGEAMTTNGQSPGVLLDFWSDMVKLNNLAHDTFEAGRTVSKSSLKEIEQGMAIVAQDKSKKEILQSQLEDMKKNGSPEGAMAILTAQIKALDDEMDKETPALAAATQKFKRAQYVMFNGKFALDTTEAMQKNLKSFTAGGVTALGSHRYQISNIDFLPATTAATVAQVEGNEPIPTGQNSAAKVHDWAIPAQRGVSLLNFFNLDRKVSTSCAPYALPGIRAARQAELFGMQPALANTSVPPSAIIYSFTVNGDASMPTQAAGTITISQLASSPFASESLLQNQYLYQNTQGYVSQSTSTSSVTNTTWQVIGRDENANSGGTYFADTQANGYSVTPANWCYTRPGMGSVSPTGSCPSLVSEFSVRCPMTTIVALPPPPAPAPPTSGSAPTPAPAPPPPPPACVAKTYYVGRTGDMPTPLTEPQAAALLAWCRQDVASPNDTARTNIINYMWGSVAKYNAVAAANKWPYTWQFNADFWAPIEVELLTRTGPVTVNMMGVNYAMNSQNITQVSPCSTVVIEHG